MPDRWVDQPRVLPYKCSLTNRTRKEHGPFYETGLDFKRGDQMPFERMYISRAAVEEMLGANGSPFRSYVDQTKYAAVEHERDELLQRVEALETELRGFKQIRDALGSVKIETKPGTSSKRTNRKVTNTGAAAGAKDA